MEKRTTVTAHVIGEGCEKVISSSKIVLLYILVLKAGDCVAAD
jgi:hypothetical protein